MTDERPGVYSSLMTDLWALLLRPSEDKSAAPKGAKTAAAALLLPQQLLLLLVLLLQLHLLLAQLGLTAGLE